MNPENTDFFGDLIEQLIEHGLEFIVCGGVAAIIHGVERTTLDLDISVSFKPENIQTLLTTIDTIGLRPRVPVDPVILANPEEVEKLVDNKHAIVFTFDHPDNPYLHLDIFLSRKLRYDQLLPHSIEIPFHKHNLRVLTAQYLLDLKKAIQPPREKDKMDIAILEKLIRDQKRD